MSFIRGYEKLAGYQFHQRLNWMIRNVETLNGGGVIGFEVWTPRHNPADERSYSIRFTPTQLLAYRDGNFVDSVQVEKRQYRNIPDFLRLLTALVNLCENKK